MTFSQTGGSVKQGVLASAVRTGGAVELFDAEEERMEQPRATA